MWGRPNNSITLKLVSPKKLDQSVQFDEIRRKLEKHC